MPVKTSGFGFFNVSVSLDLSPLNALIPKTKPVAEALVKLSAEKFEAVAKTNAPIKTGALRNSIRATMQSPLTWQVADGKEYGVYQEFGVNHPYNIDSPVYMPGIGWRYIGVHPGFPAHPFFTPAAETVGQRYFVEYFRLLGVA